MKPFLHSVLVLSLLLPASELSAKPALQEGLTYLRIHFVASDEELPGIRQAIHEGETAVEPPTHVEGFWRRKLEILRHPLVALDLRRSFQNVRRLARVSHSFENPGARDLLLSSATMFGITHGGEFATGLLQGTSHSAQASVNLFAGDLSSATADAALALSWFGLALPGLYDFGCWIGQGALMVRPTRNLFNAGRKFTVQIVGKAGHALGLPAVMRAVFEHRPARAQILEALENQSAAVSFEVIIRDVDLLEFSFTLEGKPVFDLRFEENLRGELIVRSAEMHRAAFASIDSTELHEAVSVFGWNVLGVFRQFHKLLRRDQADLIEAEGTFVQKVAWKDGDTFDVLFRDSAVYVAPERRLRPAWRKNCTQILTAVQNLSTQTRATH